MIKVDIEIEERFRFTRRVELLFPNNMSDEEIEQALQDAEAKATREAEQKAEDIVLELDEKIEVRFGPDDDLMYPDGVSAEITNFTIVGGLPE